MTDPVIEQLIESFRPKAEECEWQHGDNAAGGCYDAAYGFEEHCRVAGLNAHAVYWEYTPQGGNELYWGDTDAGEESEIDESNEHMVTLVENEGKTWLVDWTASQYNFSDFPHVQLLSPDDTGRRLWRPDPQHGRKGASEALRSHAGESWGTDTNPWSEGLRTAQNQFDIRYVPGGDDPTRGRDVRIAMAERTGDPELDALIEEFVQSGTYDECLREDGGGAWYTGERLPADQLNDPEKAFGACTEASDAFVAFLRNRGISATKPGKIWPTDEIFDWNSNTPDSFGYQDRPKKGLPIHYWVIVEKDGHRYGVDFTAAQYGYKEFPMVQRLDNDQWQREWQSKTASMEKLGASVQDLAKETLEDILGFDGMRHHTEEKGVHMIGHKPPRADIQKMKDVFTLWRASQGTIEGKTPWQNAEQAKAEWQEKYMLTPEETRVMVGYNELINKGFEPQHAFEQFVAGMVRAGETGDKTLPSASSEAEAKKFLGGTLKKYEQQHWPSLYSAIKKSLEQIGMVSPESYKLWPRAVGWIKDEYQSRMANGGYPINDYSQSSAPHRLPTQHIQDIVQEGGKLLNQLKQENRVPPNMDVNKMAFNEFESWLMEWKRENHEAEAQGEVVYEFKDGSTIQRLTTPEQLQFEGDTMGHCVGGSQYAGEVSSGAAIIYSLRDAKGVPHVTMEVEGSPILKELSEADIESHYQYQDEYSDKMLMLTKLPSREDFNDYKEMTNSLHHSWEDQTLEHNDNIRGQISERWGGPGYFYKGFADPHDKGEHHTTMGGAAVPWERDFEVVQIMGNSNNTPKPEYQRKVKEFMDSLREAGNKFKRSQNWHSAYDVGDGEGENRVHFDGEYGHQSKREWDNWFDSYRGDPTSYTTGGEDQYGLEREPTTVSSSSLENLLTNFMGALVNDYDQDHWNTNHWEQLAQEFYHWYSMWAFDPWDRGNSLNDERITLMRKKTLLEAIEKARRELEKWHMNNMDYVDDHQYEEKWNEMYPDQPVPEQDGWMHEDEHLEVRDEVWWEAEEAYAGDAQKFLNYLENLVGYDSDGEGNYTQGAVGLLHPYELPSPSAPNLGLPSYEETTNHPNTHAVKPEQAGNLAIPGTLSAWNAKTADVASTVWRYPVLELGQNVWVGNPGDHHFDIWNRPEVSQLAEFEDFKQGDINVEFAKGEIVDMQILGINPGLNHVAKAQVLEIIENASPDEYEPDLMAESQGDDYLQYLQHIPGQGFYAKTAAVSDEDYWAARQPVLYDWVRDELHIGEPGQHHSDVAAKYADKDDDDKHYNFLQRGAFQESFNANTDDGVPAFFVGYGGDLDGLYVRDGVDHGAAMVEKMKEQGHPVYRGTRRIAAMSNFDIRQEDHFTGPPSIPLAALNGTMQEVVEDLGQEPIIYNAYDQDERAIGCVVFFPLPEGHRLTDDLGPDHYPVPTPCVFVEWIWVDDAYQKTPLFLDLAMKPKQYADQAGLPIKAHYVNAKLEKTVNRYMQRAARVLGFELVADFQDDQKARMMEFDPEGVALAISYQNEGKGYTEINDRLIRLYRKRHPELRNSDSEDMYNWASQIAATDWKGWPQVPGQQTMDLATATPPAEPEMTYEGWMEKYNPKALEPQEQLSERERQEREWMRKYNPQALAKTAAIPDHLHPDWSDRGNSVYDHDGFAYSHKAATYRKYPEICEMAKKLQEQGMSETWISKKVFELLKPKHLDQWNESWLADAAWQIAAMNWATFQPPAENSNQTTLFNEWSAKTSNDAPAQWQSIRPNLAQQAYQDDPKAAAMAYSYQRQGIGQPAVFKRMLEYWNAKRPNPIATEMNWTLATRYARIPWAQHWPGQNKELEGQQKIFPTQEFLGQHTAMGLHGDLPQNLQIVKRPFENYTIYAAGIDGDEVGGVTVSHWTGLEPIIENISVHDDWKRRGIATALIEYAEADLGKKIQHDWDGQSLEGREWAQRVDPEGLKGYYEDVGIEWAHDPAAQRLELEMAQKTSTTFRQMLMQSFPDLCELTANAEQRGIPRDAIKGEVEKRLRAQGEPTWRDRPVSEPNDYWYKQMAHEIVNQFWDDVDWDEIPGQTSLLQDVVVPKTAGEVIRRLPVLSDDEIVVVGRPEEHHHDVWQRTAEETHWYSDDDFLQGDINLAVDKETGHIEMAVWDVPDHLKDEAQRQAVDVMNANIKAWDEGDLDTEDYKDLNPVYGAEFNIPQHQYIAFYYGPSDIWFGSMFGPMQCAEGHAVLDSEKTPEEHPETPEQGNVIAAFDYDLKTVEWQGHGQQHAPLTPWHKKQIQAAMEMFFTGYEVEPYDYRNSKVAKETPTQKARTWQELQAKYGPDQSEVIHQFPSGHTINKLKNQRDAHMEGEVQRHCWQGDEEWITDEPLAARFGYLSLRDPNGLPQVSFYHDLRDARDGNGRISAMFGARNRRITQEEAEMLKQFGEANGISTGAVDLYTAPMELQGQIGEAVPVGRQGSAGDTRQNREHYYRGAPDLVRLIQAWQKAGMPREFVKEKAYNYFKEPYGKEWAGNEEMIRGIADVYSAIDWTVGSLDEFDVHPGQMYFGKTAETVQIAPPRTDLTTLTVPTEWNELESGWTAYVAAAPAMVTAIGGGPPEWANNYGPQNVNWQKAHEWMLKRASGCPLDHIAKVTAAPPDNELRIRVDIPPEDMAGWDKAHPGFPWGMSTTTWWIIEKMPEGYENR